MSKPFPKGTDLKMSKPFPKGTDLARLVDPDNAAHAAAIEAMLQHVLICFVKRAGGKVTMTAKEIDDTGGDMLAFRFDADRREFHFENRRKS